MRHERLQGDEAEELAFIRSLVSEEILEGDRFFGGRYPEGVPFRPQDEDYAFLDVLEGRIVSKIRCGMGRHPEWTEYDVQGFAALVRMSLMMRFKRVEREIARLPDWNLMVERIVSAESGNTNDETGTDGAGKPSGRPSFRLIKNAQEDLLGVSRPPNE